MTSLILFSENHKLTAASDFSDNSNSYGRGEKSEQQGSGSDLLENTSFLNQLATIVSKKLQPHRGEGENVLINPFWSNYERAEPTVAIEKPENTLPPTHFSNPIFQTDLNTSFDEDALLKKVPKLFKNQALKLLKKFDEQPNDVTWDAAGHIYIDEKVLPNANINEILPALFRKSTPKKINGFVDFVNKIESMGLSSMIRHKQKITSNAQSNSLTMPENWWYLGE